MNKNYHSLPQKIKNYYDDVPREIEFINFSWDSEQEKWIAIKYQIDGEQIKKDVWRFIYIGQRSKGWNLVSSSILTDLRKEIKKTLSEQLVISDDIDVLGGIEDARDRINLILSILKPEPQSRRILSKSNQKTVRAINSIAAAREEIEQLYENVKSVYDFVIEKW